METSTQTSANMRLICDECGMVVNWVQIDHDAKGQTLAPCGHNASLRSVPIQTEEN